MAERTRPDALVFIPAFDEQATVGDVVRAARAELSEVDLLVIDDGSVDETAARARAAGAKVAQLPFNLGLGAALQTGYLYAQRHGYRYCAHMDADGQHRPADVHRLLDAVRRGDCDLAIGTRYHRSEIRLADREGQGAVYVPTAFRRVGSALVRAALRLVTRQRFTDPTSGLRAANERVMELFAAEYAGDYPEVESVHRVIRRGLRVKEIPVVMMPRAGGRSKFNPFNSAFFVFKGILVLFVGLLRGRGTGDAERAPGATPAHEEGASGGI
jgi:glycosyltransferase involved in cell wall biosynthesis